MILNFSETKQIVFRRSRTCPSPLPQIEQVQLAKLIDVILSEKPHFDDHILPVIKVCSQRYIC